MPTTTAPPDVRDRILQAAFTVLHTEGLRNFTQTRVATEAKLRQSHLTYYYPTRADLLEAVAAHVLDGVTARIAASAEHLEAWGPGQLVEALARHMTAGDHMRMFVAMIVEADRDPVIRAIMSRGAFRIQAAIAAALGGPEHAAKARLIQATIWGLGLYTFALRPDPDVDPTDDALNYLEECAR